MSTSTRKGQGEDPHSLRSAMSKTPLANKLTASFTDRLTKRKFKLWKFLIRTLSQTRNNNWGFFKALTTNRSSIRFDLSFQHMF